MLQQMQANAQRLQQLEQVSAHRAATIASLMSKWQPAATALGYKAAAWAPDFHAALSKATDGQLLDLFDAPNYGAVRALLQSRSHAVAMSSGEPGLLDLGALASDLTFTPVNPPCRIFDTRNYGGGVAPATGTQRDHQVYGAAATIGAQGGNPAGCPAPAGEPVGIAANFTAVPLATGHLRVFPFGGSLPTVSFLNFTSGVNIANAGIVSTCYLCGFDLSVYNAAQTHHIADVMGYFYPAKEAVPGLSGSSVTTFLNINCTNYGGGTVTITTPGSGYVTITAQAIVGFSAGAPRLAQIYLGTSATDCTFQVPDEGWQASRVQTDVPSSTLFHTIPLSRTRFVPAAGYLHVLPQRGRRRAGGVDQRVLLLRGDAGAVLGALSGMRMGRHPVDTFRPARRERPRRCVTQHRRAEDRPFKRTFDGAGAVIGVARAIG